MSLKKQFEETVKKLGKDKVAEILKRQKEIDELAEHIAKQQLDLGKQFIVTNPLNGVKSFPFHAPVSDTYQVQHGNNKNTITLPQGEKLSLWDWQKVADEISSVNEDMSCKHDWVNAGFHFDKWVCKKCDVNKGSNE